MPHPILKNLCTEKNISLAANTLALEVLESNDADYLNKLSDNLSQKFPDSVVDRLIVREAIAAAQSKLGCSK